MKRNIYFSFHYQDVIDFRANVVRNSGVFRAGGVNFRDASIWEEAEEKNVRAIRELIDSELVGSSVTCVLIGSETYNRRWVRYEIVKSFEMQKGLLGTHINWIKGKDQQIKFWPGENPFDYLRLKISSDGKSISFFEKKDPGLFGNWLPYRDMPEIKNRHLNEKHYGKEYIFSDFYDTYSYSWDDGKNNFSKWAEKAALNAKK